MSVPATANGGSPLALWAHDEPSGTIFAGTPAELATYLAAHMHPQPDTVAILTAELTHLASSGRPSDSLCFTFGKSRTVTIRT